MGPGNPSGRFGYSSVVSEVMWTAFDLGALGADEA